MVRMLVSVAYAFLIAGGLNACLDEEDWRDGAAWGCLLVASYQWFKYEALYRLEFACRQS